MNKYNPTRGSAKMKITPAHLYAPKEKAPSRRDMHRQEVKERKATR